MMTEAPLRKRDREPEAMRDSVDVREAKRSHGQQTDRFPDLLQLDRILSDDDDEEFAPSEELLNGVMRSLEEEIGATCSTSYPSSSTADNSAGPDISSDQEGETRDSDFGVDLCYLLKASDDELGLPLNVVLNLKDEVCLSTKETSEGLLESSDLKVWHFFE
jgi:hypothetical protein